MLKSNRYHPNIKEIISLNDLAVKYYEEKNMQKAYEICRKIYELAMLYTNAGANEERAILLFQKVAKSDSGKNVEALLQLGLSFLDKGHNDNAFDNFNKISALYVPTKEKLQLFYQIAIACEKKNLPDKAKFYYDKILSIDMQYKDVSKRLEMISSLTKSAEGKALMTNLNQRFEDITKIGEDNIWVFYKAVNKLLKRKVVINVIKEDFRCKGHGRK